MPTLHGIEVSPFVRKVRIALAEKDIDYEIDPVMHFALPEGFEELHPLRKIPVWTTDEGENIPDSSVILAYLDRVGAGPQLIPSGPVEMARSMFLEEYSDTAVAVNAATIFLEKLASPRFFNKAPDENKVQAAVDRLQPMFAYLDRTLGDRDYLVGDSLSVADLAITSALITLRHADYEVDGGAFPNLRRYADGMFGRPTIAAIFEEEVAKYGSD